MSISRNHLSACILLVASMLHFQSALSCTTFQIHHEGGSSVGYSFAFQSGSGMVLINPRGLLKKAFVSPADTAASWTSRFGSVTFNQIGREFPYCGMNEKRLVITEMALDGTGYPSGDERPAVNELQWIQYHLDTCADLDQVLSSCRRIRVAAVASKLHYMVCDAAGNCASISYRAGKLEITEMASDAPHVMTLSLIHI